MTQVLNGIIPPLVTPLLDNDTLDVESLERLIEHVINGGVHGIFILGTSGESQSLSFSLREEMIKQSSKIINGRLPLLVGISDTSLSDSARLSYIAADNGADIVVSAAPYYYAAAQPELIDFYEALVFKIALPLYLYNMPSHTKVTFAPSTLYKLSENEKVIGFKDSSANGTYLQTVLYTMRDRKDFSIFVGPEEMTAAAVLMGANGGVNGGANIFPKLFVDLYNAAKAEDLETVRKLQLKVMQISTTIYNLGQYSSSFLKGVKCALSVLGICKDTLALPYSKFDAESRIKIIDAIKELDL